MNKVITWYKMYDFVKSQPQESETSNPLIVEYLFSISTLHNIVTDEEDIFWAKLGDQVYVFDSMLEKWYYQTVKDLETFGQIKESMDNYMDNQFREAGFDVCLPCEE